MSGKKVFKNLVGASSQGLVVAVCGTVMHQTVVSSTPVGLLLAFTLVVWVGIRARAQRSQSWIFAVSLAIAVFAFGIEGNQDTMIPATYLGYAWGYGSIALALFVAMFPRLKKH